MDALAIRSIQEVVVGYIYMMKLGHLVADKIHARARRTVFACYSAAAWWQSAIWWPTLW